MTLHRSDLRKRAGVKDVEGQTVPPPCARVCAGRGGAFTPCTLHGSPVDTGRGSGGAALACIAWMQRGAVDPMDATHPGTWWTSRAAQVWLVQHRTWQTPTRAALRTGAGHVADTQRRCRLLGFDAPFSLVLQASGPSCDLRFCTQCQRDVNRLGGSG